MWDFIKYLKRVLKAQLHVQSSERCCDFLNSWKFYKIMDSYVIVPLNQLS